MKFSIFNVGTLEFCNNGSNNNSTVINVLILLLVLFYSMSANAQYPSYSKYDNVTTAVYRVEDMNAYEIQTYNEWKKIGMKEHTALYILNSVRAQENIEAAPSTIISINYYVQKDTVDSINGRNDVLLEFINTTPKTIKEITFKFTFENENGAEIYDIRTGSKFCILKFSNLAGRTKSNTYKDILNTVHNTFKNLNGDNASYFKPFYNKSSFTIKLESVDIKYADGTTSNKVAIFDQGYNKQYSLYMDGPLSPLTQYLASTEGQNIE